MNKIKLEFKNFNFTERIKINFISMEEKNSLEFLIMDKDPECDIKIFWNGKIKELKKFKIFFPSFSGYIDFLNVSSVSGPILDHLFTENFLDENYSELKELVKKEIVESFKKIKIEFSPSTTEFNTSLFLYNIRGGSFDLEKNKNVDENFLGFKNFEIESFLFDSEKLTNIINEFISGE